MSRVELLPLLIFLVYLQPWCVSCQRYLNPETFITVRQRRSNNNNLPLLRDASDRLRSLIWNSARWQHLPATDEWISRWSGQHETREPLTAADLGANPWPETTLDKYGAREGDTDLEMFLYKRQSRSCDTSQITIQTLIEYLRTGKICGRRVAHVRFGLGGRRR